MCGGRIDSFACACKSPGVDPGRGKCERSGFGGEGKDGSASLDEDSFEERGKGQEGLSGKGNFTRRDRDCPSRRLCVELGTPRGAPCLGAFAVRPSTLCIVWPR